MKSNKKKITMAIGMVLGVTVLAGAAFASYNTSNGYDVAKTAVKGLMKNENYTANMTTKISLDGNEISSDTLKELYDRNGDVKINKENKELRRQYPQANIVAVDYDPGASEVNQLNRIKLMLAVAFENMKKDEMYDSVMPKKTEVRETVKIEK